MKVVVGVGELGVGGVEGVSSSSKEEETCAESSRGEPDPTIG